MPGLAKPRRHRQRGVRTSRVRPPFPFALQNLLGIRAEVKVTCTVNTQP